MRITIEIGSWLVVADRAWSGFGYERALAFSLYRLGFIEARRWATDHVARDRIKTERQFVAEVRQMRRDWDDWDFDPHKRRRSR